MRIGKLQFERVNTRERVKVDIALMYKFMFRIKRKLAVKQQVIQYLYTKYLKAHFAKNFCKKIKRIEPRFGP
jgi:hypothetical protein